MREVEEIAADADKSIEARLRFPRLASLEIDLNVLLDRADLGLDPLKRYTLELMLLGVQTLIDAGKRDAEPDEDAALRAQMKELAG